VELKLDKRVNIKKVNLKITILKELEKLAGEFKFTEGSAADVQGNIYFRIFQTIIYISGH